MLRAERHWLILKRLEERSAASVTDLVKSLGASEATVRRDINTLAEQGKLRRIRGGAAAIVPRHETHLVGVPFDLSQGIGPEEKRAIAKAAVELIGDDESIIINGGTTTCAMVEFLQNHSIDILTNSIPIVTSLLATSHNRITLPGGTIYREQNIVLSPFDNDAIAHFRANKLFTSCYGLSAFGMMEADPLIVQAEMKLLKRADELIVLADHHKFEQRSPMIVADLEQISAIVTNENTSEEHLEPFLDAGIRVVTASREAYESVEEPLEFAASESFANQGT